MDEEQKVMTIEAERIYREIEAWKQSLEAAKERVSKIRRLIKLKEFEYEMLAQKDMFKD